jgi:dolichol kinase
MVPGLAVVSAGGLALDLARFRVARLNREFLRWLAPLLKHDEGHRLTGATYMTVAGLFTFFFFGADVAVPAMLFLALGDPVAALLGRRMPGPRVYGKSPFGTLGFVGMSLATVGVFSGAGVMEYHWGLLVGAAVAGIVELAPIPPDDNFTIPLLTGTSLHFLGV